MDRYKKYGVHCEDICDEIEAKKNNKEFEKVKLKQGEYGLYKKVPEKKGKKSSKKKSDQQMMRGNKETLSKEIVSKEIVSRDKRWIVGVVLFILIIIILILYINIP